MSDLSNSVDENTCESLSENVPLHENSYSDNKIRMFTNRRMRICSETGSLQMTSLQFWTTLIPVYLCNFL